MQNMKLGCVQLLMEIYSDHSSMREDRGRENTHKWGQVVIEGYIVCGRLQHSSNQAQTSHLSVHGH